VVVRYCKVDDGLRGRQVMVTCFEISFMVSILHSYTSWNYGKFVVSLMKSQIVCCNREQLFDVFM